MKLPPFFYQTHDLPYGSFFGLLGTHFLCCFFVCLFLNFVDFFVPELDDGMRKILKLKKYLRRKGIGSKVDIDAS